MMQNEKKTTATDFNNKSMMGYAGMISDAMPNPEESLEIGAIAPDGKPWRKKFSSVQDAAENAHAFAHSRI